MSQDHSRPPCAAAWRRQAPEYHGLVPALPVRARISRRLPARPAAAVRKKARAPPRSSEVIALSSSPCLLCRGLGYARDGDRLKGIWRRRLPLPRVGLRHSSRAWGLSPHRKGQRPEPAGHRLPLSRRAATTRSAIWAQRVPSKGNTLSKPPRRRASSAWRSWRQGRSSLVRSVIGSGTGLGRCPSAAGPQTACRTGNVSGPAAALSISIFFVSVSGTRFRDGNGQVQGRRTCPCARVLCRGSRVWRDADLRA